MSNNDDVSEIKKYVKALFWLYLIHVFALSWVMGVVFYLRVVRF